MADILYQIRQEFSTWDDYMKPKRQQILKRLEKHIKQNKELWLVNINMVSNTIDTLIAWSYIDEPQVKFVARDNFLESEQADNLNYMARFDMKEQDYQQLDYQVQRDRYFFGLGIKYRHWFDTTKMCPIFYAVNPLTAIFDPTPTLIGKFNANQYKYFGFTLVDSMFNLKNDKQYNKALLSKLTQDAIDSDQELMKQALSISDNTQYVTENLLLNYSVTLYHHFTIIDGKRTLVTTDADKKYVLRQEVIKPVLKEEKEDESLVPRPFAFYFYKPERWKVLGVSIPDMLDDKEEAKTILINANLIKARLEAFGGKFIVNSRLIKDKEDILKPSTWPQYIFTNDKLQPNESLANVMTEIPTASIKQDTLTMTQILEREWIMDTKQDQMQMWVVPDKTMTKAEQQSIQGNANMLSALNMKTYLRGEYDFRFLRWRTYQEYFSSSDEKFVLMNQDFEWKSIGIKKDMFKTKNNPFIITGSKSDIEAMNEKQKNYWNATLPIILNDPDLPKISKLIAKRFTAKLNGMPQNSINQIYSLTPEERDAKWMVEYYINDDEMPLWMFEDPNADYLTYWIYIQKANDNKTKEKVLNVLEKYLKQKWQQEGMQMMNEQANSAGNIMQSQMYQQNAQWWNIVSKQDVLTPSVQ
jgi:hypothetical protein